MNHESRCTPGPAVLFPEWRGERHYMLPFTLAAGLPAAVQHYTQTVQQIMSHGPATHHMVGRAESFLPRRKEAL